MTEHFYDAAIRHYVDGCTLEREESYDNAVYLFGNSAECALKSLLEVYCGSNSRNILKNRYGHGGEILLRDLYVFAANSSIAPLLDPILGMKLLDFTFPEVLFSDHPDRRYSETCRFDAAAAEKCKYAVEFLIKEMIMQHIDGYI